jgi:hypothetical protein
MAHVKVGRLNSEGMLAFGSMVSKDWTGRAPIANGHFPELWAEPAAFDEIPEAGYIDPKKSFKTNYDLVSHVLFALDPIIAKSTPNKVIGDPGINGFLGSSFIRQLTQGASKTGSKVREPVAYVLDVNDFIDGVQTRNYRNVLYVNLLFGFFYRDRHDLCGDFLTAPIGKLTNAMERMCQKPEFMFSVGAWEMVSAMFMSGMRNGDFCKKPTDKFAMSAAEALQDISIIVFSQCALNYDVANMSAAELIKLVPQTPEFNYWIKRGETRLGLRC